jgi:xylulokinase
VRDKLLFADDEFRTSVAPADFFRILDRVAAKSPPGSRRLLFLPWLYGERTPVEDPHLRGGFLNYSLEHERADVLRSVLEGVALNTRWLLQHVERFAGRTLEGLRFIGGGADSELWSQIFADVLGRPIHKVKAPRLSNLRGAAFIAWVGLGELDFEEVEARVPIERRFEPNPRASAVYDQLFSEFLMLHRSLRPTFQRLNRVEPRPRA